MHADKAELVAVSELKPHPRNYRRHNDDQLKHIITSIKTNGFYRNVVAAKDGTILAGHGVVEAAKKIGLARVPVIRLNIKPESPRALKVLTGDNEISNLGEVDDRLLSELLKEIHLSVDGLEGTGFDEKQLANLVFVSRPAGEIQDFDAAAEWVGLPAYENGGAMKKRSLTIFFEDEKDRAAFVQEKALKLRKDKGVNWHTTWPWTEPRDKKHVRFE